MLLIGAAMYFLMIRPQRRKMQQPGSSAIVHRGRRRGHDDVRACTASSPLLDGDIAWLEIDDNVQIRIARQALQRKVDTSQGETAVPERRRLRPQARRSSQPTVNCG